MAAWATAQTTAIRVLPPWFALTLSPLSDPSHTLSLLSQICPSPSLPRRTGVMAVVEAGSGGERLDPTSRSLDPTRDDDEQLCGKRMGSPASSCVVGGTCVGSVGPWMGSPSLSMVF